MTMDRQKHKQVVTPTAAAVPDVVSLLEQIHTPSIWHTATNLAKGVSCMPAHRPQQKGVSAENQHHTCTLHSQRALALRAPSLASLGGS